MKMPDDLPYENVVVINFEIETDKDFILDFIKDSCCCQDINGRVIITEGTLQTSFEYEHDGT